MAQSVIEDKDFQAPVDIDRDEIADEDEGVMDNLEVRVNRLRQLNETLDESTDKGLIDITMSTKDALKHDTRIGCKSNVL